MSAVCNLASIALPKFITEQGKFDHKKLYEITKVATRNLNKVIDVNYYPVPEARDSNMRHRPIGLGVQGLADAFIMLRMPFDSPEARQLNEEILRHLFVPWSFYGLSSAGPYKRSKGLRMKGIFNCMWRNTKKCRWDWDN